RHGRAVRAQAQGRSRADRRQRRLRARPHLRRKRCADRGRADHGLPPHAAARGRHRRLPRRAAAVGRLDRPPDQRQRRPQARRDDPDRLDPRRVDRLGSRDAPARRGAAPRAGDRAARRRACALQQGRRPLPDLCHLPGARRRRARVRRAALRPAAPRRSLAHGVARRRETDAARTDNRPAARTRMTPELSHIDALEAEAIHIMREVAAELERPVLLFSGGKDSIVLLRLAEKAFRPGRFPFPLMHIDTGHNFPEAIEFRDRRIAELGERLVIASVQESIDKGRVVDETGPRATRNRLQTTTLLDAMLEHGFDAAIGGARRDEERSRAKERIFSFRDDFGQWDPRAQRPELWNLYNGRIRKGEQVRVFPISNWTELDVWQYVARERLELPQIYFAHEREVFERDGMLYAAWSSSSATRTRSRSPSPSA